MAGAALVALLSGCSLLPERDTTSAPPAEPPVSASEPRVTARSPDSQVRAAQQALAELGYYRGAIDGLYGPKTRAAVEGYQRDLGISPDGMISPELLARLAEVEAKPGGNGDLRSGGGPVYEPGDAYVYTDGHVETVLSVNGRHVEWRNAAGLRWSSDVDFTLPAGAPAAKAGTTGREGLSWPLRVGQSSSYTLESPPGDGAAQGGGAERWRCSVESKERTAVAAGTFDSYKIVCRPDDERLGAAQSRTWYYAPAIGHFVRYVDDAAVPLNGVTRTRSRDLAAVSPGTAGWPAEARTGLQWAMSYALEAEAGEQPVHWESSALEGHFVIEPGPPAQISTPGRCRHVALTRVTGDTRKRLYPSVACRLDERLWQVPGPKPASAATSNRS